MMHLTFADKNLLTGNDAAELLLEYTAALASERRADTVKVACIGIDGNEVVATFVLGEGAPIMGETTNSHQPEPDNSAAIAYMRERMGALSHGPKVTAGSDDLGSDYLQHFDETI